KPGPFILAETRGAGIPYWFLDKYGDEVRMHNSRGEVVASDGLSLFNPQYLDSVSRWYKHIMPFIARQETKKDGPVIMMQVCNEIGVFPWLAHQADYGPDIRERFISYLRKQFSNISEINQLWGTDYGDFAEVELPPDGREPYMSKSDRSSDYEWHRFWRSYYGDYLRMLSAMARRYGVTVPFYHNLPGWIYGHGYEFPVNITMYEDMYGQKSDMLFGVDHIPEFVSHRNMHDDRIINDITRAMQGEKPLFAAEFQCGSREYHVVTNPGEMELFYKASVANGLTGWNYYMFSQGRNPRQRGYSGDTFYWFTPLTPEAKPSSAFPLVKRMSRIIKTSENLILDAKRKAEIGVLFYPHYYATELERPETGNAGLAFSYAAIRRPAFFDGLLKALQVLNIDYDMLDLTAANQEALSQYKQVWAFTTDEMNAPDQQLLVDYTRSGGNLVIFPNLPDREMSQKPCTLIREAIGIRPEGMETIDSPLIDIFDIPDIKCANPQMVFSEKSLANAEIIARTIKGTPCGFSKKLENGTLTHLGTWIGFDTEGHKPVYEALLARSGAHLRNADADNEWITVRQRFTGQGQAMLFVGNYYNEDKFGKVTYTHPQTGARIGIPFAGEGFPWPALYGILTPVNMKFASEIMLLHCTSDILGVKEMNGSIDITLFGDRDLPGEIVLEGERVIGIRPVSSGSINFDPVVHDKRLIIRYDQPHRKEFVLTLKTH
ncbi:MAG: beta-galactosidase, partial [bacterium]